MLNFPILGKYKKLYIYHIFELFAKECFSLPLSPGNNTLIYFETAEYSTWRITNVYAKRTSVGVGHTHTHTPPHTHTSLPTW